MNSLPLLGQESKDLVSPMMEVGCSTVGDFRRLVREMPEEEVVEALASAAEDKGWDRPRVQRSFADLKSALAQPRLAEAGAAAKFRLLVSRSKESGRTSSLAGLEERLGGSAPWDDPALQPLQEGQKEGQPREWGQGSGLGRSGVGLGEDAQQDGHQSPDRSSRPW